MSNTDIASRLLESRGWVHTCNRWADKEWSHPHVFDVTITIPAFHDEIILTMGTAYDSATSQDVKYSDEDEMRRRLTGLLDFLTP